METVISGVAQTGPVRVNNLAMLEALFNIGANGIEILLIAIGALLLMTALYRRHCSIRSLAAMSAPGRVPKDLIRFGSGSGYGKGMLGFSLVILGPYVPLWNKVFWSCVQNVCWFR